MKKMMFLLGILCAANLVLAEAAPRTPVAKGLPLVAANASAGNTNAASLWAELRDVQAKLHPFEETIEQNDLEIKALVKQHTDMQAMMLQLDKKRQALIMARLQANPASAALARRYAELQAKLSGSGASAQPGAVPASAPPRKTP